MSMTLNFEPHSWYFGHAIKKTHVIADPQNQSVWWESVYYDGIKGHFVEREAPTLKMLKSQIKAYQNNYYQETK